jgi:aspartate/glutamate racemase
MAQWNGQFTSNTHATKVDDLESALKHAIKMFHEASSEDIRHKKAKSVRKLASKVLTARLKQVKAKRYETEPVTSEDLSLKRKQIHHLAAKEIAFQSQGIDGILLEFGVEELIDLNS